MKTVNVTTEITINCPRERVAAFAADPDNATKWYVNIKWVEWKTQKPLGNGSLIDFKVPFMERTMRKANQKDLERLKKILEKD